MKVLFRCFASAFLCCSSVALGQQAAKPEPAWQQPSVIAFKKLLDEETDAKALEQATFRLFGRQNLTMGKTGAKVEATTVAWAVINAAPARVIDGRGTVLGEMKALNESGLQALALEVKNFQEFDYKVEAHGMALVAGQVRIEHYEVPAEAKPQPGVPQGRLEKFEWNDSQVFPNTHRAVTVYIPAQYNGSTPASLMVWQDGSRHADLNGGLRATRVMDTLIARKKCR